jgi:dihydropyrimidinase
MIMLRIFSARAAAFGADIKVGSDVRVHDASGLLVLPGGVDVHTHLDWDFGVARQWRN